LLLQRRHVGRAVFAPAFANTNHGVAQACGAGGKGECGFHRYTGQGVAEAKLWHSPAPRSAARRVSHPGRSVGRCRRAFTPSMHHVHHFDVRGGWWPLRAGVSCGAQPVGWCGRCVVQGLRQVVTSRSPPDERQHLRCCAGRRSVLLMIDSQTRPWPCECEQAQGAYAPAKTPKAWKALGAAL